MNQLLMLIGVAGLALGAMQTERGGLDPEADAAKLKLGETLFLSKVLSVDGTVSCASCHDPERSFADGRRHGKGVSHRSAMRNSATLLGLAHVERFPGVAKEAPSEPRVPVQRSHAGIGNFGSAVAANRSMRFHVQKMGSLSLEERCLGPIENPAEMGHSLPVLVQQLRQDDEMVALFTRAFGEEVPITRLRIGEALAEYVRNIKFPETPYSRYLDGDSSALTAAEQRGLVIFQTKGQCSSCHSGPSLTDGRMHLLGMPQHSVGRVLRARMARAALNSGHKAAPQSDGIASSLGSPPKSDIIPAPLARGPRGWGGPNGLSRFGGYGGIRSQFTQTLTLIDINRTAPYFRDGRVESLEAALSEHLALLLEAPKVGRSMSALQNSEKIPTNLLPVAEPQRLLPLSETENSDLLAFLRALSPREVAPSLGAPRDIAGRETSTSGSAAETMLGGA